MAKIWDYFWVFFAFLIVFVIVGCFFLFFFGLAFLGGLILLYGFDMNTELYDLAHQWITGSAIIGLSLLPILILTGDCIDKFKS